MKRNCLSLDYSFGGLRTVDPRVFAQAQQMLWVKHILNDDFNSFGSILKFQP